jgi:hypothetical protein
MFNVDLQHSVGNPNPSPGCNCQPQFFLKVFHRHLSQRIRDPLHAPRLDTNPSMKSGASSDRRREVIGIATMNTNASAQLLYPNPIMAAARSPLVITAGELLDIPKSKGKPINQMKLNRIASKTKNPILPNRTGATKFI